MLDRAVGRRVTLISAPAGSGKTSLLRAWAERSSNPRHVAFVAVDRDEQHAERFWSAVLVAIAAQPSTAALDGDQLVERVVSEIAGRVEPVVLIVDDLHELRSADAL
ncbi:MAG TPA: AAA family ATPase, partial [Acidimicrobiia bacterium]